MGRFYILSVAVAVFAAACSSTTTRQDRPAESGGSGTGGATGGTTGEAGSATGGEAGSNGDDLCGSYCETLEANCTGDFQQFISRATCMEFCARLPEGSDDDEIGNSVHCRITQARFAGDVGEPDLHCAEAGPGGNGTCGSNCEAYCVVLEQVCGARFDGEFVGRADCNSQCGDLADEVRFSASIDSGDSIQCRLWHLSAASVDPSTHCGHAVGEGPCAPPEAN
jgi:hypothetical protein